MTAPHAPRICILGGGSWGATLASLLAEKQSDVALWELYPEAAKQLATTRRLPFLPDLRLADSVLVTSDMAVALRDRSFIVSVTPSHGVRATLRQARESGALAGDAVIISATKGLEEKTHLRMSEVILEELKWPAERVAVLSGPSHAEEVCKRMPTAVVAAGPDADLIARARALMGREYFRIYAHQDMAGVELCGAIKNIFAIACGISDGLGFGDNARAALMTRGLNEMVRIGVRRGGQLLTFFGLAGMGDLIVTCMSRHSRNHQLGEKIGRGKTPQAALGEMSMVAEGYRTASSAHQLAQEMGLDCPLTREIYEILYLNKDPKASLRDLMSRDTSAEWQKLPEGILHEQSKAR